VAAAATSLGYEIVDAQAQKRREEAEEANRPRQIQLEVPHSDIVTDQLTRDQQISVQRGDVTITFSRDARGHASLCVTGYGQSDAELRKLGEELSQRVVQKYVYRRLIDEMKAHQFLVVEEEVDANEAIRLKVRHWEQ
jgi:hypothetical protein